MQLRNVTLTIDGKNIPLTGDAEIALSSANISVITELLDQNPAGDIIVHILPHEEEKA